MFSSISKGLNPGATPLGGLEICFLAGTLGQGGAERQLFYNLACLRKSGAKVELLCLTQGEYWEKAISEIGVQIHYVGAARTRIGRLIRIIRKVHYMRPKVIQCQHFYTGTYAGLAGRILGISSIGAIRSDGYNELISNGKTSGRLSATLPDWMAANSEAAINNLHSLGFNIHRCLLLPNVIDTAEFRVREPTTPQSEYVILGVGSLVRVKRFDRLLRIAAKLHDRGIRKLRVMIVGDGPERQEIESLAEQTRSKGLIVEMIGRVSDPLPFFHQADVLVLSSDKEGTPNAIMEAMACGVPVLATRVGGVPGIVTHDQTGFLFEPNDEGSAIASLARLVANPDFGRAIAKNALAYVHEKHSVYRLPNLLKAFYLRVLEGKPRIHQ